MNKRQRPQSPKRTTRHDNNSDKRHMRQGASQRGERFDRNEYRSQMMRGNY